jgi:signal transduction histidine kinase
MHTFTPHRRRTNRVLAGVAGGIADELGVRDGYVRAAFLTLSMLWGLGVALYILYWLGTYERVADTDPKDIDNRQAAGLGLAFVGLVLLLGAIGTWPNPVLVLTAFALSFGTAAITDPSSPGPLAALMSPGVEKVSRVRLLLGVALLAGGIVMFSTAVGQVFEFGVVFLAVFLTGLGVTIAFGPWVRRLLTDLSQERSERIRQEERAEVAAHLHDSVLQTLALIQRSDDPQRMAMLARHQEAELRDWLYGTVPLDGVDLVSTALKQAAAKVEEDFQIPIDLVTVGDHAVDERGRALVAATTEAMVTDQGNGFDPTAVAEDRRGIAESMRARMERVGGTVSIESEPGEGTEVMLGLPL